MKRLLFVGAAVVASCAFAPAAHAGSLISTDLIAGADTNSASDASAASAAATASTLNPILNKVPILEGPDRRHICLIADQVDKSWCLYVAIP